MLKTLERLVPRHARGSKATVVCGAAEGRVQKQQSRDAEGRLPRALAIDAASGGAIDLLCAGIRDARHATLGALRAIEQHDHEPESGRPA